VNVTSVYPGGAFLTDARHGFPQSFHANAKPHILFNFLFTNHPPL